MHKRKPKNFNSHSLPTPVVEMSLEEIRVFDYEVCWCLEELKKLLSNNPSVKQVKEAEAAITILKDPKVPVIKKKQTMRQTLGDYKKKIEENISKGKQIEAKFNPTESVTPPIARTRYEKGLPSLGNRTLVQQHSGGAFRFNFNLLPRTVCPNQETTLTSEPTTQHINIPLSDNSFRFNFNPPQNC